MKTYPTEKIRNVALVGHGGSGKTTLAEALLARAGAINRVGRVEDGTTASDTEPEEQKRSISISLAVLPFEWKGHKVNLIDTPGYADFVGDVQAALRVADLAVFVVSAVEGVEVQTEVVWRRCAAMGIPRHGVRQQARPRAGQLRAHARPAPRRFGAGVAPSSCPSATRRSSAASPTSSPTPPSSTPPTAPTPPRTCPTTWPTSSTRCTTTSSRASWWPTTS